MSTSIAIVTPQGIVAASDSRASVCNPSDEGASDRHHRGDGKRDLSHVAYHVDGIGKVWSGRRACATWVSGNVDEGFFRRLLALLSHHETKNADDLAAVAHEYIAECGAMLKMIVAGYGAKDAPRLWLAGESEGLRDVTRVHGRQHMYAIGRNEAFIRLFGDVYVPMEGAGSNGKAKLLASTIDPERMTLQAAIDFAVFYIELVGRMEQLRGRGHQIVGGPLDVAVTTADGLACIHRIGTTGSQKITGIYA